MSKIQRISLIVNLTVSFCFLALNPPHALAEGDFLLQGGAAVPNYIPLQSYIDTTVSIEAGETVVIQHGLGGYPQYYMVYVYGHNDYGYHQANYGTNLFYRFPDYRWMGLEWQKLTDESIEIHRGPNDDDIGVPLEKRWDEVRVKILKPWPRAPRGIPYVAHFDTTLSMSPGEEEVIEHNLGGDPGDYLVYMYGENTWGLHQANYGTNPIGFLPDESWIGVEWQELTSNTITIVRSGDDAEVPIEKRWNTINLIMIRVDLERYSPPYLPLYRYDCINLDFVNDEREVTHGLGGDPHYYLVHLYGVNDYGLHHANYGTNPINPPIPLDWCGAEWQEIDSEKIMVIRGPEDDDPQIPPSKRWDGFVSFIIRPLGQ